MPGISLGGLASGMDSEAIITQLMQIERQPKTRLAQRELVEEARKTALSDIRSRLQNLANAINTLRDASTWADVQTVESSDAAKVVVARTGGGAAGATTVRVDRLASADQITQQNGAFTKAGSADKLTIAVGSASVTVDVAADDDVAEIAKKINGSSGTPVYASVLSGKLVLSGKTAGESATITVSDGDADNGYDLAADLFGTDPLTHKNTDARISVDGGSSWVTRSSNTIDDLIAGVTLTLKGATTSDVTVTVGEATPDTAAIQKKIQAFVDQYNSTADFIRGKLEEKKVANPTTTAERQKGVLNGDPALLGLLSKLRQSVGDRVTGNATYQTLSEVGLSTGKASGTGAVDQNAVKGQLTLDSAMLSEKLSGGLDDVKQLFTNAGAYGASGLAQRLDGFVDPWLHGNGTSSALIDARIASSDSMIKSLKDREAGMDVRLASREKALRAQFTALETALSKAQSQGTWLAGQIAALSYR